MSEMASEASQMADGVRHHLSLGSIVVAGAVNAAFAGAKISPAQFQGIKAISTAMAEGFARAMIAQGVSVAEGQQGINWDSVLAQTVSAGIAEGLNQGLQEHFQGRLSTTAKILEQHVDTLMSTTLSSLVSNGRLSASTLAANELGSVADDVATAQQDYVANQQQIEGAELQYRQGNAQQYMKKQSLCAEQGLNLKRYCFICCSQFKNIFLNILNAFSFYNIWNFIKMLH